MKVGDKAPLFEGKNQNGKTVSLNDYISKKLILYFYPKDNTPGCTKQACNLRDNYDNILQKGFHILGVSIDTQNSHKKFIEKFKLPFDLISDTDHRINELYGTWKEKKNFGKQYYGTQRTTFVINNGIIEKIITKPDTSNHANQLLD